MPSRRAVIAGGGLGVLLVGAGGSVYYVFGADERRPDDGGDPGPGDPVGGTKSPGSNTNPADDDRTTETHDDRSTADDGEKRTAPASFHVAHEVDRPDRVRIDHTIAVRLRVTNVGAGAGAYHYRVWLDNEVTGERGEWFVSDSLSPEESRVHEREFGFTRTQWYEVRVDDALVDAFHVYPGRNGSDPPSDRSDPPPAGSTVGVGGTANVSVEAEESTTD